MASRATTMTKWLDMSVSVRIWAKPMMNDATIVPPTAQAAYDANRYREDEHVIPLLDDYVAEGQK